MSVGGQYPETIPSWAIPSQTTPCDSTINDLYGTVPNSTVLIIVNTKLGFCPSYVYTHKDSNNGRKNLDQLSS